MGIDAFRVVRDLESALCEYTGAKYAVATTSCTMALLLAVAWQHRRLNGPIPLYDENWQCIRVEIPRFTYVGVPQAIIHAGGRPVFRDEDWRGQYQLKPLPVWDAARLFTSGMYHRGAFQCVSFHISKILGDTQGGAILHDDAEADAWLRKARFDGRTEGVHPKNDSFDVLGYHAYMSPDVAARLLWRLSVLPKHNDPLPWGPGTSSDYADLSKLEIFK